MGRYEMNGKGERQKYGRLALRSARDIAQIAVFVALVIGAQLAFSAIPGVEVVTVLFVAFSFTFGVGKGAFAATAFTLLRNFLFGLFPTVLVLYLIYYNALACVFGLLGRAHLKGGWKTLFFVTITACVCTAAFTLLDDIITPLFFTFDKGAWRAYFYASLPIMFSQIVCTAITVGALFAPLKKVFSMVK